MQRDEGTEQIGTELNSAIDPEREDAMLEILFESSTKIILMGIALVLPLTVLGIHYSNKRFFYAAGIAFAAMVGALIIERSVETTREQVYSTVYEMAALVARNDHQELLKHFSNDFAEAKEQAAGEMPSYDFDFCTVLMFKGVVVDENDDNKATADFRVTARLSYQGYKQTVIRDVKLAFQKEADGKWRVTAYQHFEPFKESAMFY